MTWWNLPDYPPQVGFGSAMARSPEMRPRFRSLVSAAVAKESATRTRSRGRVGPFPFIRPSHRPCETGRGHASWGSMPELPDIAAYIAAPERRVMGLPLEGVRLVGPFLLRTATPALSEAAGRTVRELRRVGKRIAIGLDGDLWVVLRPRDFFPGWGEGPRGYPLAPTRARGRGRAARRAPRGPRHWGTNQTVAVLVLHLMIAGCLHWKPAHAALHGPGR